MWTLLDDEIFEGDRSWATWPDNLWGLELASNPNVNFCIQTLLADGLRVPPFDRHAAGSGRLSEAGMTPDHWLWWFRRVVSSEIARRSDVIWPMDRKHVLRSAADLWAGPEAVGQALEELTLTGVGIGRLATLPRRYRAIDRQTAARVRSFRSRLPRAWVFVVDYPAIVSALLAPAAIVVSGRAVINSSLFGAILLRGLEHLSDAFAPEGGAAG